MLHMDYPWPPGFENLCGRLRHSGRTLRTYKEGIRLRADIMKQMSRTPTYRKTSLDFAPHYRSWSVRMKPNMLK